MKTLLFASLLVLVPGIVVSAQSMFDKVNDFDGDGRADYAITRNENGLKVWHIWRSTAGYLGIQWAWRTIRLRPAIMTGMASS